MDGIYSGCFEDTILDEIALEGLEGITIDGLWIRLAHILHIDVPLPSHICTQVWNFLLKLQRHLKFFIIPTPRDRLRNMERVNKLDPDLYDEKQDECPSRSYKYNQIEDDSVRGSCEFYKERAEIGYAEIKERSLEEVHERWGQIFIIVAEQHLREQALIGDTIPPSLPREMPAQSYCFLERIGRSRHYGEATIGKHSLLNICNDSVMLFYIRNNLSNLKLITKQHYYEKSQSGSLLHLPRFATTQQSIHLVVLADAIRYLKNHNGAVEHGVLKKYLIDRHELSVKKIFQSALFKKYIISEKVPYRDIFPNAQRSQWARKSNPKDERTLNVLKLKDINVEIDDIFEVEEGENEDTKKEFLTKENTYVNLSVTEQIFEKVKSHGGEGCSQSDLAKFLGIRSLCIRRFIKKMTSMGLLSSYVTDAGRQRLKKYILTKYKFRNIQAEEHIEEEPEEIKGEILKEATPCDDELLEPLESKTDAVTCLRIMDKTEPDFKMLVEEIRDGMANVKRFSTDLTPRQKIRRNTVLKFTKQASIIDANQLIHEIKARERKHGYKDEICRKSLSRILMPLINENILRVIQVQMEWRNYSRPTKLVCMASIHLEHKLLSEKLLMLKESFFNMITMKRRKNQNTIRITNKQAKRSKHLADNKEKASSDRVGSAKYIRGKLVHEMLYYLVYELNSMQCPIEFSEVSKAWREFDLSIDASELRNELPDVYSRDVNWMMFISPLPIYENHPNGWICIKDFLLRIPISLLVKLHRINDHTNLMLEEYLKHPIRRYYSIHNLPLEMRDYIRFDKNYVRTIEEIVKMLGYMGLVQFGPRSYRDTIFNYIYINQNALILDTTTSEPGYAQISPDREYREIRFTFKSQEDIANYWLILQNTCVATKLGYRLKRGGLDKKTSRYSFGQLPEVPVNEAVKKDVGYLIGNRRGAAGLDWRMFSYKQRNWDLSYNSIPVKRLSSVEKSSSRLQNRQPIKLLQRRVRQVIYKRPKKQLVLRKLRKVILDDVDKECMKRMDLLRVRWTQREDRMLLVCRVATSFLQGDSASRLTNCFIVRDILHWHLRSLEKSSRACQRRIWYLLRNRVNVNQVNSWLNDLSQSEYMNQGYGHNFTTELRKLYPDLENFIIIFRIYFVQVVAFLMQLLEKAEMRQNDLIPETLEQFDRLYQVSGDNNTTIKHFDPTTIEEVEESTINALIHSSVCSQRDKMLYNMQLFEIYRSYSEGMIERCYKKVRSDQMIVMGKIVSRQNNYTLMGKQVSISNIYRLQFSLLMPYSIYTQHFECFDSLLRKLFESEEESSRSEVYTSVNSGTAVLLMELLQIPAVHLEIYSPKQILKFDPNEVHSSVHTPDKILDHFRNVLDLQQVEYGKEIGSETTTAKVRFNSQVAVHKIRYSPYDIITKLTNSSLHFFCALQHLDTTVDIDELQSKDYNCPFRCILQDPDYLATITKLLEANEAIITHLNSESYGKEPLVDKKSILLSARNILQVANYIRCAHAENIMKTMERKDIGNVRTKSRPQDIARLAKDVLHINLTRDDEMTDDDELHTERSGDGLQRYQDLLVVNTPKMSIGFKRKEDFKMVPYKNMKIPEIVLPGLRSKQDILDKAIEELIWKYTETTVEELNEEMITQRFSSREQNFTIQVLEFIEQFEFGVKARDLVESFSNEPMLLKSLAVLKKLYLIKRVGVGSYMYVHRVKIKPWIIHSFHLKRLERESVIPQGSITYKAMKRKLDKEKTDEPESKKSRDIVEQSSSGKRVSKPVQRYTDEETQEKAQLVPAEKIRINMRPAPWMRVNGSLNRRVFDKWMGTILLECTIRCTIIVKTLFSRFNQLHPANILFMLECLQDLGCVKLKVCKSKRITLFSEDDTVESANANELSRNEDIYVVVQPDALMRMSLFIGDKKYQVDF